MEMTIGQALQRGVTAHREGRLQEAERFYRAILQSNPTHPDANHNLGVLAVSLNKAGTALPLFKAALDANPLIDQFWFSYIDALIKVREFSRAKQILEQAKKQGLDADKLKFLDAQVAKHIGKRGKAGSEPPKVLVNNLLAHYQSGRFGEAEKLSKEITRDFPEHQFAWKVLGAVLGATDRKSEALEASQTAVSLSPKDPQAHYNLGVLFKGLGRLHEAQISYNQAIALKPNFAEAHFNLANTLKQMRKLDEAECSYNHAIACKKDYSDAHFNLANMLKDMGRSDEAIDSYAEAVLFKPTFTEAYVNLGIVLKNIRFSASQRNLYKPLNQLLSVGNFVRPKDVVNSILSLLRHDVSIKDLLHEENATFSLYEAIIVIESLDKLKLLHYLMRICPLPDLQFERLFVAIRCSLLVNLEAIEVSTELLNFLSTLSLHCFVNEYTYIESEEETRLIDELQVGITQTFMQSGQPETIKVLCLASYRPLHRFNWCRKLECLDNLDEVKRRLIEEPLLEKVIIEDIPVLNEISNDVSLKVREQYEENPYPRWSKLGVSIKARPIAVVCDELNLQLHDGDIKNVDAPYILVAGCGTGQHSIGTASRFSNCHVTAVDLSLASLAYAKRKSDELCFTNIDYLQGDILQLRQIGKEFDIIESAGVLHHMDEPMTGWRVLVDLLKPGGLMNIGLYSELARRHITEIRKEISAMGIGTSEADIRKFRQSLIESGDENHRKVAKSDDFFSLSALRDLIFHVQEHHFTLPQIKNCLDELGLKFCGFENKVSISEFKELHGRDADVCDLELWRQFEARKSMAFVGMYQFWCQKPHV